MLRTSISNSNSIENKAFGKKLQYLLTQKTVDSTTFIIMAEINLEEITPEVYNSWDCQRQKKILNLIIIEEVRRHSAIWDSNNPNYLTKGGACYNRAFVDITKIIKTKLSPRYNINKVKNQWQKLRKAYVLNWKLHHGFSTYKFSGEMNFLNPHLAVEQERGPIRIRRDRAPNNNLRPIDQPGQPEPVVDRAPNRNMRPVDHPVRVDPVMPEQLNSVQAELVVDQVPNHILGDHPDQVDPVMDEQAELVMDRQEPVPFGPPGEEDHDEDPFNVVNSFVEELHVEYLARRRQRQMQLDLLVAELFQ